MRGGNAEMRKAESGPQWNMLRIPRGEVEETGGKWKAETGKSGKGR